MTVIDLVDHVRDKIRDTLNALAGEGLSEDAAQRAMRRLLMHKRIAHCKRLGVLVHALHCAGHDPLATCFVTRLSRHDIICLLQELSERADTITYKDHMLSVGLFGGANFELTLGGVRELLCMVRIGAELVGFEAIDAFMKEAATANTIAEVESAALSLAGCFDKYRQRLIGSPSSYRKRRLVISFLAEQFEGEDYRAQDIGSDRVLSFWCLYGPDASFECREYETVHRLFVTVLSVLENHTETEYDPHAEYQKIERGNDAYDDWHSLLAEDCRLKLLSKTDLKKLSAFTGLPSSERRLMESVLWQAAFGIVQRHLTNGISSQRYDTAWQKAAPMAAPVEFLSLMERKLEHALWGVLHLLIEQRKTGALRLAFVLDTADRLAGTHESLDLRGEPEVTVPALEATMMQRLCTSDDKALASVRSEAKKAWSQIEREGYHADDLASDEFASQVDMLTDRLCGALAHVKSTHKAARRACPDDQEAKRVRTLFDETFRKIYETTPVSQVN